MYSVIVPAYNCEETIVECLNSIYKQTALNLVEEIIVVNDGSIDKTEHVIKEYIINKDDRKLIRYYYQKNTGVSSARNFAINNAKAEWIALLDSDDVWFKEKLEIQTKVLKKNPNILFLGSHYPVKFFLKKKHGLVKLTAKEVCIRNMPFTPTVVYRRDIAKELGLYDNKMRYGEDLNFHQKFLIYDSYYVLAQKLVNIGIQKDYFSQSGLSSNSYEMFSGRNRNIKEIKKMGLINQLSYILLLILSFIKYVRRTIVDFFLRRKYNE